VPHPGHRCRGVGSATLDGIPVDASAIPLEDDGKVHRVEIVLGVATGLDMQVAAGGAAERRDSTT